MIRKANAIWKGDGRNGTGALTTQSGALSDTLYGFKTRFENEPGTNPEELIAAAHAGCFSMALAFGLQAAGFTPRRSTRRPPSPWIQTATASRSAARC
jgi:osmotically inducible protein OsmC